MFFSRRQAASSARSIGSAGLVLDVEDAGNRVAPLERPVEVGALAVERDLRAPRSGASERGPGPSRASSATASGAQRPSPAFSMSAASFSGESPGGPRRRCPPARRACWRLSGLRGAGHERDVGARRARRRARPCSRRRRCPRTRTSVVAVHGSCRASSSSEMSAAATECVRAPTEIASAPAPAYARTRLQAHVAGGLDRGAAPETPARSRTSGRRSPAAGCRSGCSPAPAARAPRRSSSSVSTSTSMRMPAARAGARPRRRGATPPASRRWLSLIRTMSERPYR